MLIFMTVLRKIYLKSKKIIYERKNFGNTIRKKEKISINQLTKLINYFN